MDLVYPIFHICWLIFGNLTNHERYKYLRRHNFISRIKYVNFEILF